MGGPTYSVTFKNNSSQMGNACLFQRVQDVNNAFPVAWMARPAYPQTSTRFQWNVDYSFVWGQTGRLMPGVSFNPGQVLDTDPVTRNQVTFTFNGYFTFENLRQGPPPGALMIQQTSTIPMNQAAVGIGMSGKATTVAQAQPNLNTMFPTHSEYWIAFGNYQEGEVLDPYNVPNAARISFPPGVYSMVATLNQNGTWTIQPGNSNELADSEAVAAEGSAVEDSTTEDSAS